MISGADFDVDFDPKIASVRDQICAHVTQLPRRGKMAGQLTDQEKFALAFHAGAPWTSEPSGDHIGHLLTFRTTVPVGIADRGDGGWIVAIGKGHG